MLTACLPRTGILHIPYSLQAPITRQTHVLCGPTAPTGHAPLGGCSTQQSPLLWGPGTHEGENTVGEFREVAQGEVTREWGLPGTRRDTYLGC